MKRIPRLVLITMGLLGGLYAPALADEPAPSNASFDAKLTKADGTVKSGHVDRVERSEDWYAEKGWTDKALKLTVSLEGNGATIDAAWKDILSIDITYGSKSDIDCQFDGSYTPIMYMCVLKSNSAVKHVDGKTWAASSRHQWKFVFSDGSEETFYVNKLPRRAPGLEDGSESETDLYMKLQKDVLEASKGVVTKIEISGT